MKDIPIHLATPYATAAEAFVRLLRIMDELREHCPWDKKQTPESLRPMTIEEMYELADAIVQNDWANMGEELGDLLLHITFYVRLGFEEGQLEMAQVIHRLCDKLVQRHPHIYSQVDTEAGLVAVQNEEDVKRNWEKLKLQEGKTSVLSGVPVSLPAMVKALRMQEKARKVGFEWENKQDVWKKVEEEMQELHEAEASQQQNHIEEEFGDLLFSLVNYARFLRVDPELALERTNQKFRKRFMQMEDYASRNGLQLEQLSLAEMDAIWNRVKKEG